MMRLSARKARARDRLTLAYVYDPDDARLMAVPGVDVVVGHMDLTAGSDIGAKSAVEMDVDLVATSSFECIPIVIA